MHLANCRSLTSPTDSSDEARMFSGRSRVHSSPSGVQLVGAGFADWVAIATNEGYRNLPVTDEPMPLPSDLEVAWSNEWAWIHLGISRQSKCAAHPRLCCAQAASRRDSDISCFRSVGPCCYRCSRPWHRIILIWSGQDNSANNSAVMRSHGQSQAWPVQLSRAQNAAQ